MVTVGEYLHKMTRNLMELGIESPRLSSEIILSHSLNCTRSELYCRFSQLVDQKLNQKLDDSFFRCMNHEPIAYIIGHKEFYGLDFVVTRDVLIPRDDTELLIDLVISQYSESASNHKLRILDIGTGSGCIAIALKKNIENCSITAWDISLEAIKIADRNAQRLDVSIDYELKDALDPRSWINCTAKFDIIVSNPPYISFSEQCIMSKSVLLFEPKVALFAEEDGLEFYRMIALNAPKLLRNGGKIFLEVGFQQANKVCDLLDHCGWKNLGIKKDLAGYNRVVIAEHHL